MCLTSLLLLLSRFSRVQLCETPQMAAHQAPLSLGFSRQEHWSGLPLPSLMHESEVTVGSFQSLNPYLLSRCNIISSTNADRGKKKET